MIQSKTLYSLDKKGCPISWTITWQEWSNWYSTTTGRVGGTMTTTKRTFCKGKNKGRSNETTDREQCLLEVKARIEKQYKKDFHDEIPTQKRFEVTLAKEFKSRKKFIKFPMLLSAKLDGFRCYITKDGMFSRTHHEILSCPHIFESLKPVFEKQPDLVLDGELYCHALKDDFNQVASLLSRTKNLTEDFLNDTRSRIRLHLFDCFTDITRSYSVRCSELIKSIKTFTFLSEGCTIPAVQVGDTYITSVNQVQVNSFEEVESMLDKAIEAGFEGIMLRDPSMVYDQGRSSNLIKYKRFQDSEYKVIDIQEGAGNQAGQAAIIICEDKNGTVFSVGTGKGWDQSAKTDLFLNKENYIGKMATIVYQELTPDEGVPRFGKLKAFREE
jgi:DNA ligase-1